MELRGIIAIQDVVSAMWVVASVRGGMAAGADTAVGAGIGTVGVAVAGMGVGSAIADDGAGVEGGGNRFYASSQPIGMRRRFIGPPDCAWSGREARPGAGKIR
jgi:hypothetical protein